MQLEGKVVLVTGASSGIGRAIAIEAIARGATVILTGRRQIELMETASSSADPERCLVVPGDLTSGNDRARLIGELSQSGLPLHYLVNNAGAVEVGPVARATDAEIAHMIAINVTAPILLTRACLPYLERAGCACIVNIGSMFGEIAFPYFAAYSATKHALHGFSDGLRRELAQRQIAVTYVAPRATLTPAAGQFASLIGPMKMDLDRPEIVAKLVWDGVRQGRRAVYPGLKERFALLAQRLFPRLVDDNLARMARDPQVLRALDGSVSTG